MVRKTYSLLLLLAISFGCQGLAQAQTSTTREAAAVGASVESKASKSVPASSIDSERVIKPAISKAGRESAKKSYKAGVKYGQGGLFSQAVQSFQQAIAYDPEFADAYVGLGHGYIDLGLYDEAIATLEKAIELNPESTDAYTRLGQAYSKRKEENARPKQEKSAERITRDPPASEPAATTITESGSERSRESIPDIDPTLVYYAGVGDVLDVQVPGRPPNESTSYAVSSNGQLDHPVLAHPVKVLGFTTEQISALISAELRRVSIRDQPSPEVSVREYNSHTIMVSGLVKEPGTKILRREAIPLYVVLADAQPLTEAAIVNVMSQPGSKSRTVELSDPEQTTLLIRPGDVVTVKAAMKLFFYVGGNVKSPGELPFRSGLTLTQAILSAGGLTLKGDKVQLTRGQGNGLLTMREFKLKEINTGKTPDPLIEAGDRIIVLP